MCLWYFRQIKNQRKNFFHLIMKDTPYYLPVAVYPFKENSTIFYLSSKGCKQNAILTLLDHQIMTTRSPSMYFRIPPHPETIWRKYFKYIFVSSLLESYFVDESIRCKDTDYHFTLLKIFLTYFSYKSFFNFLFSCVFEHQFYLFLFFTIPQITTCRNMTFVDDSCTKLNRKIYLVNEDNKQYY